MANWCNNKVTFTGVQDSLIKVVTLFQTMIDDESKGEIGQMPDFIESKDGYFFEIYQDDNLEYTFEYETRWSPNIEILRIIANRYNVGFVLDYEESGCMVFGKTIYENKVLTDYFLNQCDFQECAYNADTDCYDFEGVTYEYKDDIMKILLERKIDNTNQKTV